MRTFLGLSLLLLDDLDGFPSASSDESFVALVLDPLLLLPPAEGLVALALAMAAAFFSARVISGAGRNINPISVFHRTTLIVMSADLPVPPAEHPRG